LLPTVNFCCLPRSACKNQYANCCFLLKNCCLARVSLGVEAAPPYRPPHVRVAANATHGREARATAAKREKAAGENPAVENQHVPIWEPAHARRLVFNGYHMGTKVPIQLPFWGGVSPLQPARSAVFPPAPPLPPGNRPIPPATATPERPAAATQDAGACLRRRSTG
jgi:hypothetical protein